MYVVEREADTHVPASLRLQNHWLNLPEGGDIQSINTDL